MSRIFRCLILSALISGSLVSSAASQASGPPKTMIPPQMAKECTTKILADSPKTKITGPFGIASWNHPLTNWSAEKFGVKVIAAPARIPYKRPFTGEELMVTHVAGCIFDTRDGVFVFRRVTHPNEFPIRPRKPPGKK